MRALSAAQAKVVASPSGYATHLRVKVANSLGALQDLTTMAPRSLVESAEYGHVVDQHVSSATISVIREHLLFSLAPFVETSKLNLESAVYVPLLQVGRRVTIEVMLVPLGMSVSAGAWMLVFDGYLDKVSWGGDTIQLDCRDKGARVQDAFIEQERVYGLGFAGGARVWEPSLVVAVGERLVPSKLNGHYYQVTQAGITGAAEQSWPTSGTAEVTDGTAKWQRVAATSGTDADIATRSSQQVEGIMQAILNDWLPTPPTLYVPAGWTDSGVWSLANLTPGWNVTRYVQSRMPVMDALRTLADQIGAALHYRWRESASEFQLTFYEPNRDNTTADRTFGPNSYRDVESLDVDISEIRNVVEWSYFDSSAPDNTGQRAKRTVRSFDSISIAKYGRRYMAGAESSASQVDDEREATMLVDSALSDLSEPNMTQQVDGDFFPFSEVTDLIEWEANGTHYTSDQKLALMEVRHRLSRDRCSTSFGCRGKPSTGKRRHHKRAAAPGVAPASKNGGQPSSVGTTSATATVGGGVIDHDPPLGLTPPVFGGFGWEESEFHLSPSAGFTPSSSTLKQLSRSSRFDVSGLTPAVPMYGRIVPRGRGGKAAPPTEEFSFTPKWVDGEIIDPALQERFRAKLSSAFALEGATSQVKFNAEDFDVGEHFSLTFDRFVAQYAGTYQFQGRMQVAAVAPGDSGYLELRKNGTAVMKGNTAQAAPDAAGATMVLAMDVSALLLLAATDYVELWFIGQGALTGKTAETANTFLEGWRTLA